MLLAINSRLTLVSYLLQEFKVRHLDDISILTLRKFGLTQVVYSAHTASHVIEMRLVDFEAVQNRKRRAVDRCQFLSVGTIFRRPENTGTE